jgi:type II secretory pathway component GspD/PulD (secretin)
MGGLIEDELNLNNVKVPLLGDIPILGYLFRSDSKNRNKQNLLVFVTPTIVQDQDFQPTKTDFLKTPVPTKDEVDTDWSAWDSGKPKDWSQPSASADFQNPDALADKTANPEYQNPQTVANK